MNGVSQIDEAGLERLVHAFYARVREDAELGPIFNAAIADWPEHLGKLTAFWSSVMLTSGRYKGQPVPAHLKHRGRIDPAMFDRWLNLWRETARDMLSEDAARMVADKADRIAESLKLGLFFRIGRDGRAVS